jgi:hypothetical protein
MGAAALVRHTTHLFFSTSPESDRRQESTKQVAEMVVVSRDHSSYQERRRLILFILGKCRRFNYVKVNSTRVNK